MVPRSLTCYTVPDLCYSDPSCGFESLAIRISNLASIDIVLVCAYRRPNYNISEKFLRYFEKTMSYHCRTIICGDFNLPMINWSTFDVSSDYGWYTICLLINSNIFTIFRWSD